MCKEISHAAHFRRRQICVNAFELLRYAFGKFTNLKERHAARIVKDMIVLENFF